MKALVIGAGRVGTSVIKQLQKNPDIEIIVNSDMENPTAVREGIVKKVDIVMQVNPLNFKELVERTKPDIVLIARSPKDWGYHDSVMGAQLVAGLEQELASYKIPVIIVSYLVVPK